MEILALILQVVGFVLFCRLGANLSGSLYKRSKWAPLAVAGVIMIAMLLAMFYVHPPLAYIPQTFGLWLIAFAGGLLARAQQHYTGE